MAEDRDYFVLGVTMSKSELEKYLDDTAARRTEAVAAGIRGTKRQRIVGKGSKARIVDSYDPPDNLQVYNYAMAQWKLALDSVMKGMNP